MRLRKSELTQRVNADLTLRYDHEGLTSFAGLEFFRQYFGQIGLRDEIRRCLGRALPRSDFGIPGMVLVIVLLIITGGRRLRHLGYLQGDPIVHRCAGLDRLPTAYTVGRWLAKFDEDSVDRLRTWNETVVARGISACNLRRLTLDIDGSVVSTGLTVEGARRGFNPHHRKVPSYYPITAYEANSSQILRVHNRPGNVHDGKASIDFLTALAAQLERTGLADLLWEFRMDGAFFRADVIERLVEWGAEYAIKVPFYQWLDLQSLIVKRKRWKAIDDTVSYFEVNLPINAWQRTLPVVIYRKKVGHQTRKNYQLDLFDPDDGYYEYSAIVSNKALNGRNLWYFMCGRGAHEKAYAELKSGFAFATVPTHRYHANSAWQVFSILAFNLTHAFQAATGAETRTMNRKRTPLHRFDSISTLRFTCINRAGLITRPQGRATLDVGTSPKVRNYFSKIVQSLQNAA
ncbi:MAG: IS1380 family transposase [Proteobacteria bacterium]|nr:IS1380 family transposase [Pseudomonadota bacterium]